MDETPDVYFATITQCRIGYTATFGCHSTIRAGDIERQASLDYGTFSWRLTRKGIERTCRRILRRWSAKRRREERRYEYILEGPDDDDRR